ncbi:SDR family oxidoreductase [Saccharopolyspora spinosa]|uniref:SDR family oxidoreductase n=1 Tax=Saccharopolyspora spinosa TaxID=60894 RepID=UPI00376F02FD
MSRLTCVVCPARQLCGRRWPSTCGPVVSHLHRSGSGPKPPECFPAAKSGRRSTRWNPAVRFYRYLPVDVRDSAALTEALAEVRAEWGPITGLVHGAGVLADKTIKDKTGEQFDYVFGTKVDGLRTLLDVTAEDPLDLLCVFSSVAACYGNAGQSDYGMANEVITQIAAAERAKRPGCLVRTIAWGPWDGGMVDASLADRLRASGVQLIPLEAGAKAFVDEVLGARDPVQVVCVAGTFPKAEPGAAGEIVVTDRSHPYLADHSVAGTTVVPVAMVLEWFTAAAHLPGTSGTAALRDLDVLRKITLDHFAGDGDIVRISCEAAWIPGPAWHGGVAPLPSATGLPADRSFN